MRPIKSTPRSAKTLLEVVVILSIMSVVVGACVTSLGTLFRLRHQFQRDREQAAALARLGTMLRTDAHQATSASLDNGCLLTLADGRTIRYEFSTPRIVRRVERDGQTLHCDTFMLAKTANATFERDGDSSTSLIRLAIRPAQSNLPPREIPRSATIEAAVGLHAALAQNARQPWKTVRSRRRGAGLIIALTTLLVVMLMTGTIVQALVTEIRQTRRNASELQAHWLADAALARAAAQIRADVAYSGETWRVTIDDDESDVGVAEVRVERTRDNSQQVKLVVEARYPDHPTRRITTRRELAIPTTVTQETTP